MFRRDSGCDSSTKAKTPIAPPEPDGIALETIRADGTRQHFAFAPGEGCLKAKTELPEPHEFEAVLTIRHGEACGDYEFAMEEHHHESLDVSDEGYQDAHERAHAKDIARDLRTARHHGTDRAFRTDRRPDSLSGGSAILLVCLQLKQFTLGFTLVLCFSFGLALTMVSVGAAAAWSVQHASRRIKGFGEIARRAPVFIQRGSDPARPLHRLPGLGASGAVRLPQEEPRFPIERAEEKMEPHL